MPGVLEVRLGSEIVYMSDDGRYLLQGRLFDLDTRENLTDRSMTEVRRGMIDDLAATRTINFGPDEAPYKLYVFTDVDCGYCRKLHEQIDEYIDEGIQIRYAAFPRAGEGSATYNKMVAVWCADDPQQAITEAKRGKDPAGAKACDAPVSKQYRIGQAMGVTGTPALLTADGDLIPGYVPPKDLRARLEALAASKTSIETAASD